MRRSPFQHKVGAGPTGFLYSPARRAEPPALPAVRAGPGPGRAVLQQHGGPSESSRGRDRSDGGGGATRGAGGAEPRWPLGSWPPRSVPRRGAFKKCLVIPSLTSVGEEGTWLPPAVAAVRLIVGEATRLQSWRSGRTPSLWG